MAVYVVIVNWRGWQDTIECLESLLRSAVDEEIRVVVCDNGSDDESLERIRDWASGRLCAWTPPTHPLRELAWPPLPKPIPYVEYDRAEAERGGDPAERVPLVIVRVGANRGFSAGNNAGLRYALARGDFEHAWLLNNDTIVPPDALQALLDTAREDAAIGMCGSTLLYHHDPTQVQTLGGAEYNRWLALPRHIGAFSPADAPVDQARVTARLAYVSGASMLVSRALLERVGLLDESYFLYFEELDWATRAAGRFRLGYAAASRVYHKEGASIGAHSRAVQKNEVADYHFLRNRLLYTRRYARYAVPTVHLALLVALFRRLGRGQWGRVRLMLRVWTGR
jgi:GT2 family glycosyltransferase